MATTSAERMRKLRQARREAAKTQADPATYVKRDFVEFTLSDDAIDFGEDGIFDNPFALREDADARLTGLGVEGGLKAADWREAEDVAEELIETARLIAAIVNAFKRREIEAAMDELKNSDLTDAAARDAAFREVAKLDAIKRRLRRRTRHDFETMSVKGEVGTD